MTRQLNHLSAEQFDALLSSTTVAAAPDALAAGHLAACPQCTTELAQMRDSLALFRQASTAYADAHLRPLPRVSASERRPFLQPAYWATAAAALFLAAFLPLQRMHQHSLEPKPVIANVTSTTPARTVESDEALLDSVNSEISESVPTPMQALADPTTAATNQNSTQRKD